MKRVLGIALVLAACGAFVMATTAADEGTNSKPNYWIEFGNAFGLIEGADFKLSGTRAGKITEMKVDRKTKRALIGVTVSESRGVKVRTDAFCETRPQSLLGEYFIDCSPGRAKTQLKPGSTIPIGRTATTIPIDLVNNILRLPQRERLRIIINELGTGVAGRGEDLNEAVRRAVPALRQTDRLLAVLARENQTLKDLTQNGDKVLYALANNKEDVGRFVEEARDTAVASAERRTELAGTFRRLPGFLRELRPTMFQLGRVADEQTPALADLNRTSTLLTRFFNELGPFAEASRVSFRSLGELSVEGRRTIPVLRPTVRRLGRFSRKVPELGKNLAITLEDLDDRGRAVEKDGRSPGGQGYTGLEALLQYVFDQGQAINVFDQNGHILKVSLSENKCSPYRNAEGFKKHEAELKDCVANVGPVQPGLNAPDPSINPRPDSQTARASLRAEQFSGIPDQAAAQSSLSDKTAGGPPINLSDTIRRLIPASAPSRGGAPAGAPAPAAASPEDASRFLDFLLAP